MKQQSIEPIRKTQDGYTTEGGNPLYFFRVFIGHQMVGQVQACGMSEAADKARSIYGSNAKV